MGRAGAGGFRHDINGLRALAVLAVLLFHFQIPPFSGGFAGVDVFFVISGFLMTQIILSGVQSGTFGVGTFYLARARRIVPALMALCTALLVFGLFFIDPLTYEPLAESALASQLFVSNFLYAGQQGYFAPSALQSWLLHT